MHRFIYTFQDLVMMIQIIDFDKDFQLIEISKNFVSNLF